MEGVHQHGGSPFRQNALNMVQVCFWNDAVPTAGNAQPVQLTVIAAEEHIEFSSQDRWPQVPWNRRST